jgi:hypothetical protein
MTPSKLHRQAATLVLAVFIIASCQSAAEPEAQKFTPPTDVPTTVPPTDKPYPSAVGTTLTPDLGPVDFAFPQEIDRTNRYMFYLHGKIIEDQGLPAVSPEYGEYRYEEILKMLQSSGFVVISEQRPREADPTKYALRVVRQVDDLLNSKVTPGSITVVGASKGAAIATIVSNLVGNSEVNYVLLGGCYPPLVDEWKQQGISLSGNVLSIYDSSDEYASSCEEFFAFSEGNRLGQHAELVLHVGTGHGILYEPLSEWVVPTVEWAIQK